MRVPVAAALAGLALSACTTGAPRPEGTRTPTGAAAGERAVAVRAVPVERTDLVSTANYTGDVRARSSLMVVPKATDRVEIVGGLAEGDRVALGATDLKEGDRVVAAPASAQRDPWCQEQVTSGNSPDPAAADTIVLIHGLWMTPLSWERWVERCRARGHGVVASDGLV